MVAVEEPPPLTVAGERLRLLIVAGVTVSAAVCCPPPRLAVMVTGVLPDTAEVDTVNVADVAPAATVTLPGTVALLLLDDRATDVPPGPAAPVSITVPVELVPPSTDAGEIFRLASPAGVIVRFADAWLPANDPVIEAAVDEETALVPTVNVADVEPAGTDTDAGTVALPLPDARVTEAPPGPAAPLSVTAPVELLPPNTDVGETVRLVSVAAFIVSVAVLVTLPATPVIVAVAVVETALVFTVKVAEVEPAAMATLAGSVALALLDDRVTAVPPGPALPLNVAVPVELLPPVTDVGDTLMLLRVAGEIVSVAVFLLPPCVPVIVAVAAADTAVVFTVKLAELAPEATVTDPGTVALPLFDDRLTAVPPGPAGPLSVAVPVDGAPPWTDVGDRAKLDKLAA